MEDVCIVCNRAIEWSSEDLESRQASTSGHNVNNNNATSSPSSAAMQRGGSSSNRSSSNPGTAAVSSSKASSGKSQSGNKKSSSSTTGGAHHTHHHPVVRGHHSHTRIRRNQSHGKLDSSKQHHHSKSGLKPLTSTTSAANAAAISAAVNAIVNAAEQQESKESDAITSENLPDWMAIYCSEECRNEDELRSRLSFANLTEERERSLMITSAAMHAAQSSNGGTGPRAYSASSLSPTFGPVPRANSVHSPWCNDSEGSEFEWHQHHHHSYNQKESHHAHTSASRHRASLSTDSSDIVATSGSEGRRYSDASDASRLSVYGGRPPTVHHPHARRSSSRTRGSTDSLASMGSSGYEPYSSSGGGSGTLARPDIGHRSTSALSGGLRAMTPIHQQPAASTSASPRMTSPGRMPSNSKAVTTAAVSPRAGEAQKIEASAPSTSSGTTASISIGPKTSTNASSPQAGSESESLKLASSTFIAPSSAKTFRPASISRSANGGSFLKPSKSSATLALSAGEDVRATMVAERTMSQSPVRRPANAMPRGHHHQHRSSHHTSTGSIPYLSCSPSSPGSGSMTSGRSNVSTDPSSSSVRGDGEYSEDYESDDGEYRPLPRKQEDERHSITSLSNYGLFYQRTPSTPSLPSLVNQSSYGRSPPAHSFSARNARLSSSYDTKDAGSTTISSVFRERQNRPALNSHTSSSLRMTPSNGMAYSPRRAPFDLNAAYQQPAPPHRNHSSSKLHPPYSAHAQADNTPTQSGLASRSQSFVGHSGRMVEEPVHEVVQEVAKDEHGRTRAPSITRTDLERIASDRSIHSGSGRIPHGAETTRSSSSTLQRLPSHLRSSTLSPQHSHSVLPSPPISPGLYAGNGSHPALNQLAHDEEAAAFGRPLLANARSKSRSSFTWDHLPPYVPQYAALDLDKVRRNKSGTSLHSVYEDDAENNSSVPSSQQSTVKSVPQNFTRKRLFYFPGADEF